jgi:hypothetical protein
MIKHILKSQRRQLKYVVLIYCNTMWQDVVGSLTRGCLDITVFTNHIYYSKTSFY